MTSTELDVLTGAVVRIMNALERSMPGTKVVDIVPNDDPTTVFLGVTVKGWKGSDEVVGLSLTVAVTP